MLRNYKKNETLLRNIQEDMNKDTFFKSEGYSIS